MSTSKSNTLKFIFLFLILTFSFSSVFYYLMIQGHNFRGPAGLYAMGLQWSPAIAAYLVYRYSKRNIRTMAWNWGLFRFRLWAYLLPLFYATVCYVIIWLTGLGHFYNKRFVSETMASFGFTGLSDGLVIVSSFILFAIYMLPVRMAHALGEEIGWRGFLVPELMKITGYTQTSLISGMIWAVWHFPILILSDYNNGTPAWYGLTCFTVLVMSNSFVITWLRLRSDSIWPAVLLHASHNLFIQSFFTPITQDTGNTRYFVDEFGAFLALANLLLAYYFWTKRHELKKDVSPASTGESPVIASG